MKTSNRILAVALAFGLAGVSAAAEPLMYRVKCDRTNAVYACGTPATFTVTILGTNGLRVARGDVKVTLDNFGPENVGSAVWDLAETNVFTITGVLKNPGFLRLTPCPAPFSEPKVWSVAYEPEKIRKGSPSPVDFDEYWVTERVRLAREVPLDPVQTHIPERSTSVYDFYRISFATFGRRVHGYMTVPTDASHAPFPVDFQVNAAGFGDWTNDMAVDPNAICVRFSVYPFEPDWRWRELGLKAKYDEMDRVLGAKYSVKRYCVAGLGVSREDYFFHPVLLGIDRAVDWVARRPDVDRTRFRYFGTSQGGGFGCYIVGLNSVFTRAVLYVPALTDTMGYLAGRQSGWPQVVENNASSEGQRRTAERWAPYFDGANFASRIRCPVRIVVGFSDTTCPPCGVYAAYNEIRVKDKAIAHGLDMTHSCRHCFYKQYDAWCRKDR